MTTLRFNPGLEAIGGSTPVRRLLITAGPTHEPIDAVRFLGNRSSGRLGIALADAAAARDWSVTLLLGPSPLSPRDTRIELRRFRSTKDLEALLDSEFPRCHALIMAAAVADFRPITSADADRNKIRRSKGSLTLELEATPDLLATCAGKRRPEQRLIGFALEPRKNLLESAHRKLQRKGLDAIVANPLETMDSATIEATILRRSGPPASTPGAISKERFAEWLLDHLDELQKEPNVSKVNPAQ